MPHINHRPASYIPPTWRSQIMSQFTKADLAELCWDFVQQEHASESPDDFRDEECWKALLRRREIVILARSR
jgi:hypothetical protein